MQSKKLESRGEFTEFPACPNYPAPGKNVCKVHSKEPDTIVEARPDQGRMTRQKLLQLGLHIDELESGVGCRKRTEINQGQVFMKRKVTAGMLYMIRSCGVSLNHKEMIHAGISSNSFPFSIVSYRFFNIRNLHLLYPNDGGHSRRETWT